MEQVKALSRLEFLILASMAAQMVYGAVAGWYVVLVKKTG